jgi:hypothetical protein
MNYTKPALSKAPLTGSLTVNGMYEGSMVYTD